MVEVPAGIHADLRRRCLEIKELADALEGVRYCDEEIFDFYCNKKHKEKEDIIMEVTSMQVCGVINKIREHLLEIEHWFL